MTITTRATARAVVSARNTIDLGASSATREAAMLLELAAGTDAGQADLAFSDTRTLAASATEDLDLAGALTDPFGVFQVFARLKLLVVQAAAGNTNNVLVGRASSNGVATAFGATGAVIVRPGGFLMLATGTNDATGHAVTAATGDLLTISNSGAGSTVTYSILAVGCSA